MGEGPKRKTPNSLTRGAGAPRRQLLEEQPTNRGPAAPTRRGPGGDALAATPNVTGPGKTKYFGRTLPPACALRGCYLTDDDVHFYCTNAACERHRGRRTKHSRYGRHDHLNPDRATLGNRKTPLPAAVAQPLAFTRCPWCASPRVSLRLLENDYSCGNCAKTWT